MKALQNHGYRVLPVNPQITGEHVHGEYVWRDLSQIGVPIDMVDIFRRPDAVGLIVDDAIAIGAKAIWMQLGVRSEEHTSELQSLMRISYAVFCLKKKKKKQKIK